MDQKSAFFAFLMMSAILINSGCAGKKNKSELQPAPIPQGYIRRTTSGISLITTDNSIIVSQADQAVKKAGIRPGDIILEIDGQPINKRIELLDIIESKDPGQKVLLKSIQKSDTAEIEVTLAYSDFREDIDNIIQLLWTEAEVNLAVLAGTFSNADIGNKNKLKQWKNGRQSQILTGTENLLINIFKNERNFTLINRENIKNLLNERALNQSDLMDNETRKHLENVTGSTHILIVSHSLINNQSITTHKLIDAGSGKILCSIMFEAEKNKSLNIFEILFRKNQFPFT